jgi:uncharacterized protein (TIGR03546 family)
MSETLFGLLQKTSSHARPNQIAWAIVWGVACGLLPKTSLLFPLALMLSFVLPIHLVAAGFCIIFTSLFAFILHPMLGNLGHWIFQYTQLGQNIYQLDKYPLVPWLRLHNTVVVGTLVTSAVMAIPAYLVLQKTLSWLYVLWLRQQYQAELLTEFSSQEVAAAQIACRQANSAGVQPKPIAATLSQLAASPHLATTDSIQPGWNRAAPLMAVESHNPTPMAEVVDSIHSLEDLLERIEHDELSGADADAVLKRATKATQLIDEILQSLDNIENSSGAVNSLAIPQATAAEQPSIAGFIAGKADAPVPESVLLETAESEISKSSATQEPTAASQIDTTINVLPVRIDSPQIFQAHDTTISIYRRARTGDITVTSSAPDTQQVKDSMATANQLSPSMSGAPVIDVEMSRTALSTAQDEKNRHSVDPRHEEALRHLLTHLRALKEKV